MSLVHALLPELLETPKADELQHSHEIKANVKATKVEKIHQMAHG